MRYLHPTFSCIIALLHPPLYLLVLRVLHSVVGASARRCTFARKIGQHRTIACYPCFVPAVAHVRYDKLLPRHQGPRHRMYFHAGDVSQIRPQATKVIRRDTLRSIREKMVCHPGELYISYFVTDISLGVLFNKRTCWHHDTLTSPFSFKCLFVSAWCVRVNGSVLSEKSSPANNCSIFRDSRVVF